MSKRSLFSILSEQPWWVSLVVAALLFAGAYQFLPEFALFVALPFIGVAIHVAWKQFRGKTPANAAERLAALREMPWEEFSSVVSAAYRKQGYAVEASPGGGFDFTLRKNGQITLVHCRRWKVSQTGVGPVRELCEAMAKHEAFNCVCISAGEFSANAREFAAGRPVTLLNGAALAELVGAIGKKSRR
jgi:restriction system protein